MRLRLLLACSLALALPACSNKQHEAQQEFRSRCEAFVPGTTTVRAASQALSQNPTAFPCQNNFKSLGGDDVCPYVLGQTQICELVYEFPTTDCSGPFSGGACADYCLVRVANTSPGVDTTICARQWLPSQQLFDAPGSQPAP